MKVPCMANDCNAQSTVVEEVVFMERKLTPHYLGVELTPEELNDMPDTTPLQKQINAEALLINPKVKERIKRMTFCNKHRGVGSFCGAINDDSQP